MSFATQQTLCFPSSTRQHGAGRFRFHYDIQRSFISISLRRTRNKFSMNHPSFRSPLGERVTGREISIWASQLACLSPTGFFWAVACRPGDKPGTPPSFRRTLICQHGGVLARRYHVHRWRRNAVARLAAHAQPDQMGANLVRSAFCVRLARIQWQMHKYREAVAAATRHYAVRQPHHSVPRRPVAGWSLCAGFNTWWTLRCPKRSGSSPRSPTASTSTGCVHAVG